SASRPNQSQSQAGSAVGSAPQRPALPKTLRRNIEMKIDNFFAELKRRNVYKVAIAYAVVAWLLIQAASIFLPTFNAPQWAMQIVILIVVVGFPIALAFSWAFEITPEGIKRESEVTADQSITHHTGRKIVALTIVLAVVATGLLIFQFVRPRTMVTPRQSEAATVSDKSIAVLPFENLSDDKNAAYFADGIQDEILTKLASIADLKVISRTSTAKYSTLAAAPTKDTAAYDLFLKGEYEERLAQNSLKAESFDQAATWYRQAIARDPGFALAIARLVQSRMLRHWFVEQMSEAELAEIRQMTEQALTLAPNLAGARIALGQYYYYGYRDYEHASAEFGRAIQLQPNNSQALQFSGYAHRRQGQWKQCLAELKEALEQDPRDASLTANLASAYNRLRMWKDAGRTAREALSIDPHAVQGMTELLRSILDGSGDVNEAQRVLATFPAEEKILVSSNAGDIRHVTGDRAYVFISARNFQAAMKVW